jgi:hypothetical protein
MKRFAMLLLIAVAAACEHSPPSGIEDSLPTPAETNVAAPSPTKTVLPVLSETECDHKLRAVFVDSPEYQGGSREAYFGKGTLKLGLTILESGAVTDVKVVEPMNPFWDPKWVEAARGWEFEPCLKNGIPRVSAMVISITMDPH